MADSFPACGICSEKYTKNARCPRILNCFHTLCTSCIENLIQTNSKQCPLCRMNFTASRARDVVINQTMLELMRYSSSRESSVTSSFSEDVSARPQATAHNQRIDGLKKETIRSSTQLLGTCQDAQKQVEKAINEAKDLNVKFCQETTKIENILIPKITTIKSQNTRKSEELDKTSEALHEKLKEVKSKQRQLDELKGKLDVATSFKDAASVMDVAEETNCAIREWIDNFKDFIAAEEHTLEVSQEEIKVTKKKIDVMLEAASSDGGVDCEKLTVNNTQYSFFQSVVLVILLLILLLNLWPVVRGPFSVLAPLLIILFFWKQKSQGGIRSWNRFF